ncbi:MAG: ABC transporter permease [Treponemataceae bacterium]|nr:ABC transporter permease [Treponemataceae bacterium]
MSNKNQNTVAVIMKRELKSYFSSFVAYLVTFLFLLVSGFLFFMVFFLDDRADMRRYFIYLPLFFALFIPALTMRLFSEEMGRGTIETLMTLPVNSFDVVMGKYLAAFITSVIMLLPTLIYVITVSCFGHMDPGPLFCQYLGAVLLAATFSAVGIFASSLTKNQIVAFLIAFGISIVLAMIDQFLIFLPAVIVNGLQYISAGYHFSSMSRGIIDSRDLIYFVSVSVFFIALTVQITENRRRA